MKDGVLDIEDIIKTYNPYIYAVIKNCISSKEDIEELLSDVFMVLWQNRNRLDKNTEIKPYLIGITKNLIKKKYRELNNVIINEDISIYENEISSFIDINTLIENNEKGQIVSNVIETLKEQDKQIFIMFYYKSQKVKQISKDFKLSESKVKVILHRTRKKIKKELKKRGYDYV